MIKNQKMMAGMLGILVLALPACSTSKPDPASGGASSAPSASAASASPAGDTKSKPVKLTLRHTYIQQNDKLRLNALQDAIKATEDQIPGLTITVEGLDGSVNRFQKLRAEMAAGNPPDIFIGFGGSDTQTYVKAGRLLDLTDFLTQSGMKDKFINLSEFTVDGHIYGLPMTGYAEGFFYNKEIFQQIGVDVPKTWDDLLSVADKAKQKGFTPISLADKDNWVANMLINDLWVREAGPDIMDKLKTGEKKWTDPAMLNAFTKYGTLISKGYFTKDALALSYEEQLNNFMNKKAAIVYDGSWAIGTLTDKQKSSLDENNIGFFKFPTLSDGVGDQNLIKGSFSNGFEFSAKLDDQQKQAAYAFIKNLYNDKSQKSMMASDLPSMKLTDYSGVSPLVKQVMDIMSAAGGTFPAYDAIIQPQVEENTRNVLQKLVAGSVKPEEAAKEIQKYQDDAISSNK